MAFALTAAPAAGYHEPWMFTGIVAGTGVIKNILKFQGHSKIQVHAGVPLGRPKRGDSIAVDGCCLTITQRKGRDFWADLSPETLAKTTLGGIKKGQRVNLELPLRMGDPLGGHWVQGHVDGVGRLVAKHRIREPGGEYFLLEIRVPLELRPYMVPKGSVAIDGISLTINRLERGSIHLCVIPHTAARTTLTGKRVGASLNVEADFLVKFMEQRLKVYFPKRRSKK